MPCQIFPRCRNYFGVVISQPEDRGQSHPIHGRCATCGYEVNWTAAFPAMARSAIDKIPPGPKLDALTAEKVFGWRKVHKHEGSIVGKKQDKAGRWRLSEGALLFDQSASMYIQ